MERQKLVDRMCVGKNNKGSTANLPRKNSQFVAPMKQSFSEERLSNNFHSALDDYFDRTKGVEHLHGDAFSHNGAERAGLLCVENRVSINIDFKSKEELSDIKAGLRNELMSVRKLMKRIERYSNTKMAVDSGANVGRLKRVHSVVDSVDGPEIRRLEPLLMPEGKRRGVVTGKVGKVGSQKNLDVTVQMKKPKAFGQKNREEFVSTCGMENSSSKVFKSCNSLLNKLMKSKVGWVFNKPVDVKSLGLHDYFTIIKRPMDLGTIKLRLNTKGYRKPEEFAEDVRLTFYNALTYNLEGHDVHTFAKQLLKMFEDNWVNVESDYLRESSTVAVSDIHIPTQRPIAPSLPAPLVAPLLPPTDMRMKPDISEAVTNTDGPEANHRCAIASGIARGPKPKAKDIHKRLMTLGEKEKLSSDLQNLPPEKLEGVLRIIKKRNPSLCQNYDEIEVDIDNVDTETLWELDRFVIYYKKAMSKTRRRDQLDQVGVNDADSGTEEAKENASDEKNNLSSSSNEREKEGGSNANVSDGSSSSGSDSGSSSSGGSESDTDSSAS